MEPTMHFPEQLFSPMRSNNYHGALDEMNMVESAAQKPYNRRSVTDTAASMPKFRRKASHEVQSAPRMTLNPIDSLPDFTYVLDPVGQILFASAAVQYLFGYSIHDVVGHNIMEFIHNDDVHAFVTAFNDSILLQSNFFHYHRLRRRHGDFVILETTGHAVYNDLVQTQDAEGNIVPACKFFVLSARAYPTKSISAFDNLLELKLQNEQLKSELRNLSEDDMQYVVDAFAASSSLRDPGMKVSKASNAKASPQLSTRPNGAQKRTSLSKASKDSGKTESAGQSRSSSLTDDTTLLAHASKKENTSPSRHGAISPLTSTTQLGSAAQLEEEANKKNKKPKTANDQHTCTDCGTTDSPEWRKGPQGPKTLCNACGLRYSKKQKKTELLLQEQLRRRDTSTPRSDGKYDMDLQAGPSGSVTPIDRARPVMSRGYSLGNMSAQWPMTSASAAAMPRTQQQTAALEQKVMEVFSPHASSNNHFWSS